MDPQVLERLDCLIDDTGRNESDLIGTLQDIQRELSYLPGEALRLVAEKMQIGDNHAGPEMTLLAITSGARFVEIPVNYLPRVGTSSATSDLRTAIAIGLRTISLIGGFRRRSPRVMPPPPPLCPPPARTAPGSPRALSWPSATG